eukprot:Plantae.Rhodophyta-Rhodochaete_pulchella.ctg35914.p1 GENE.Plantae.Rhodophyta-Rhodochaete_pulchella.ctg35914~~Plantae.Rhodophyta-Rhodochaete_pulchella.ctg35914.p1  ORF type:complete len:336 (+),score=64.20 Plantae.Rhodophyta-Rhodochaete_pulchella.ctg35914:785-1792(+)
MARNKQQEAPAMQTSYDGPAEMGKAAELRASGGRLRKRMSLTQIESSPMSSASVSRGSPEQSEGVTKVRDSSASMSFGVSFPAHLEDLDGSSGTENSFVSVTINEPVILPAAEPGNKIKNTFAIPHDGFRSEVIAVYRTLQHMKKKKFMAPDSVIKDFFVFWNRFEEAYCDFFKLEEQVTFALIESHTSLDGPLLPQTRQHIKMEIIFLSQCVGRCAELFENGPNVDAVKQLIASIDNWVQKFLNYLGTKDEMATRALRIAYSSCPSIVEDIEAKMAKQTRAVQSAPLLQMLMIKQMTAPELKAWKSRYSRGFWDSKFYRSSTREYRRFRKLLKL